MSVIKHLKETTTTLVNSSIVGSKLVINWRQIINYYVLFRSIEKSFKHIVISLTILQLTININEINDLIGVGTFANSVFSCSAPCSLPAKSAFVIHRQLGRQLSFERLSRSSTISNDQIY